MNHMLSKVILRRPEPGDIDSLYQYKNDPAIASNLGGFSYGFSRADIAEWIEVHRRKQDETVWAVCERNTNRCIGHVGLYAIDSRVRCAEFGILIGDPAQWGKGIGTECTAFALNYAFNDLNLNRVSLTVLETNAAAIGLYREVGFREEGRLRQAQFKGGRYVDVIAMAILRDEYSL